MDIIFAALVVLFAVFGIPVAMRNVIILSEKCSQMFARPILLEHSSGEK